MARHRANLKQANITNKKRRSWNCREKLAIITYLEKNPGASKRNTAEKFGIEPKQLREWIKKRDELMRSPSHIKRLNIGRGAKYPLLETDLIFG